MVLKSTVLKPTLLIRLTGIFCFTVNRGCAVGADSLNGKKRLLSDVVAAGGGTYSFVPFIYYFLAREQAPIIDTAVSSPEQEVSEGSVSHTLCRSHSSSLQ